jgi:hypothetical protein
MPVVARGTNVATTPNTMSSALPRSSADDIARSKARFVALLSAANSSQPPPALATDGGDDGTGDDLEMNLGSGDNPMSRAVNVDVEARGGVDVVANAGALPFSSGLFSRVHSINPYGYNPVSPETARVMRPGGLLFVTATPRNPYGRATEASARAAGFELVHEGAMVREHRFGVQRTSSGGILNTTNSTTRVYRRVE